MTKESYIGQNRDKSQKKQTSWDKSNKKHQTKQ